MPAASACAACGVSGGAACAPWGHPWLPWSQAARPPARFSIPQSLRFLLPAALLSFQLFHPQPAPACIVARGAAPPTHIGTHAHGRSAWRPPVQPRQCPIAQHCSTKYEQPGQEASRGASGEGRPRGEPLHVPARNLRDASYHQQSGWLLFLIPLTHSTDGLHCVPALLQTALEQQQARGTADAPPAA